MGEMFVGRYELIDQIGEGGMGSVWRVHDHNTGRLVAAKLLRQSDAGSLLRFMREQGMRIRHDHVVTPLGWAGEDGRVIFTMPLIEGGSFSTLLKDHGPLPPVLVAELLRQTFDGLAACHNAGIVHRDIKPANILLDATDMNQPSAWITDFGIAVAMDAPRLTGVMTVLGTPGYMSPEQAQAHDPDPRQDLYSSGIMGLQLLTGLKPSDNIRTRRDDVPPRPQNVPDSLWNLLLDLAEPQVNRRIPSAAEALNRLNAAPELQWDPSAARNIPGRLPPVEKSGDFVTLHASEAGKAMDDAPSRSHVDDELRLSPATTKTLVATKKIATSWAALPVMLLAALAVAFMMWQPWVNDGGFDADHASTGGACYFSDVGTTAKTVGGKDLTCTEKDGSYTWEAPKK